MTNFRQLMDKYISASSEKEKRLIKRDVHSKGYGRRYGTLVVFGKLFKTSKSNVNAPKWQGPITDVNTGTQYHASIWDNGNSVRIEICKQSDIKTPVDL